MDEAPAGETGPIKKVLGNICAEERSPGEARLREAGDERAAENRGAKKSFRVVLWGHGGLLIFAGGLESARDYLGRAPLARGKRLRTPRRASPTQRSSSSYIFASPAFESTFAAERRRIAYTSPRGTLTRAPGA
jgi:hypothetical protein